MAVNSIFIGGCCLDQILFDFVVTLAGLLRLPLIFLVGCFGLFAFLVFIHIVIGYFQGKRFKKGVRGKKSRRPILLRLFLDLPKQYAADIYAYDPEFFRYQGMIIYTGRQGNGKTISMIRDCRQMLCRISQVVDDETERIRRLI